jgi:hypothetical protein
MRLDSHAAIATLDVTEFFTLYAHRRRELTQIIITSKQFKVTIKFDEDMAIIMDTDVA